MAHGHVALSSHLYFHLHVFWPAQRPIDSSNFLLSQPFFSDGTTPRIYTRLADTMQADVNDTGQTMVIKMPHVPPEVLQMIFRNVDFYDRKSYP